MLSSLLSLDCVACPVNVVGSVSSIVESGSFQVRFPGLAHSSITCLLPSSKNIFTYRPKVVLLLWILFALNVSVCHTIMSVHCSLVVTCRERACLLAFLYVMFSCVFVTFQCGAHGQVWYLIVSIPHLCLLPYFATGEMMNIEFYFIAFWLSLPRKPVVRITDLLNMTSFLYHRH